MFGEFYMKNDILPKRFCISGSLRFQHHHSEAMDDLTAQLSKLPERLVLAAIDKSQVAADAA